MKDVEETINERNCLSFFFKNQELIQILNTNKAFFIVIIYKYVHANLN